MEQNNLRQKDMVDILGSQGIISEVLNRKRQLNKRHIELLSQRFKVSPESFSRVVWGFTQRGGNINRAPCDADVIYPREPLSFNVGIPSLG